MATVREEKTTATTVQQQSADRQSAQRAQEIKDVETFVQDRCDDSRVRLLSLTRLKRQDLTNLAKACNRG